MRQHPATMSADENAWVFDSLVGFLQGPIWNAPILTFIEQKSQIFEPSGSENETLYKEIHDEYKDLVDTMLGSYMEDIGMSPEQFASACSTTSAAEGTEIRFHQTLFEQVWAANDYEIFKRMMIQKNVELQLQALEMIQQQYGITPASFLPGEDETKLQTDEEARILEEVIKKSIEEYQASQHQFDMSSLQMEQSIIASREEHSRLEAEVKKEKELFHTALQHSMESSEDTRPDTALQSETTEPSLTAPLTPTHTMVDKEELAKRQQYLKSQRDKLLAMKKQEREKQLHAAGEGPGKTRPRSARAAQTALSDTKTAAPDANDRTLQVRKALADRLKAEVVGKM